MTSHRASAVASLLIAGALFIRCTGGQESNAAEEQAPRKNGIASTSPAAVSQAPEVDAKAALRSINAAIPISAGAKYRDDLTRRDSVTIKNQYGPNAEVYTLATDDSFPQVYHYYTTYLAQFRAYPAQSPYPATTQTWRTLDVQLNQAMQDPFIPGDMLKPGDRQVMLQIAETEAEPKTVIRYVITPQPIQSAQAQTPKPAAPSTNAFDRE
jgi:hypothetical protein